MGTLHMRQSYIGYRVGNINITWLKCPEIERLRFKHKKISYFVSDNDAMVFGNFRK